MTKLMLIGMTIVTGILLFAFVAPSTATGALRALAPSLHLGIGSAAIQADSQVASANGSGPSLRTTGSSGSQGEGSASTDSLSPLVSSLHEGHSVATSAQPNCGRFGNGFHGGKHNFTCPNQPFPVFFPGTP